MAYGQVKLEGLRDDSGEYEDPDKLARSGRGGGNYKFPISQPEAPVYATCTADTGNSGKTTV